MRNRNKKMKTKIACEILTFSVVLMIITSGIAVGANTIYNTSGSNTSLSLIAFQIQDVDLDHVVINEFEQNPHGKDAGNEWVELYNPTSKEVDIRGWVLSSQYRGGRDITIPDGTVIHPKGYWTYAHDKGWLRNENEWIILKDSEGKEIDRTPLLRDIKDDNCSWQRYPNGMDIDLDSDWQFRLSTEGYSNGGQSHFPYMTFNFNGTVTVFTSPDSSFKELANAIDNANESIYLNVYQFHNFYLMDHLRDAINRGINVKVFLEGYPVNGIKNDERYIAAQIANAGGEVRFMIDDKARGIHDRYNFNHAKYATIDNKSTLIMSENWKSTGVPVNSTFGNRGWGIIINNLNVTSYFTDVFFEDWKPESKDSFSFTTNDTNYGNKYGCPPPDFEPNRTILTGNYTHPFDSKTIIGEFNVSPVLSPDTSLLQTKSIIGMINSAEESVYIEQLYIYKDWWSYADTKNPFLDASINASRRGCDVRILLNPTYTCKQNWDTIDYVRDVAANEGLNLEAKFIDIDSTGLNKTHNKGVIVDSSTVLISSINWNENSARNNREAGVIVENDAAGGYYTDVFLYDWNSSNNQSPIGSFTYSPENPVVNQIIQMESSKYLNIPLT